MKVPLILTILMSSQQASAKQAEGRREALRSELHTYAHLHTEPDLPVRRLCLLQSPGPSVPNLHSQGWVAVVWKCGEPCPDDWRACGSQGHARTLESLVFRPELEALMTVAGDLKTELKAAVKDLDNADMVYPPVSGSGRCPFWRATEGDMHGALGHQVVEAGLRRVESLLIAEGLEEALKKDGKAALFRSIQVPDSHEPHAVDCASAQTNTALVIAMSRMGWRRFGRRSSPMCTPCGTP
jgi:hypothetical protein